MSNNPYAILKVMFYISDNIGLDAEKLIRAATLLDEGLEWGLYPGAALFVSRHHRTGLLKHIGHTDFSRKTAVNDKTIYDLASLTKPVATAPAILLLHQDGIIDLEQNIIEFFPDRNLAHLKKITLHHLITHTSGLPPWRDLHSAGQTREQAIDELFAIIPEHEPGAKYAYSCLGYIILGLIVENITRRSLGQFTQDRLFRPMGMLDTMFNPLSAKPANTRLFAATDNSPMRKRKLMGEVHDENAFVMGGESGNAGLFSNISDLVKFSHDVIIPHDFGKKSPLGPATLKMYLTNSIPNAVGRQSMGWFLAGNSMLPTDFVSKTAIGHTGFTGTALLIEPEYELVVILLSNRVCNDDDGVEFRKLRRLILNAAVGAIV